ncbi:MAG: hypothetical protein ABI981_03250 [Betaproteobacteria bacterium]
MSDTARGADAIRYMVLLKLASGLRHAMMGDLQTLQFSAELCVKMLQAGRPLADVEAHIASIPSQTEAAAATVRSIIEWLRPTENAVVPFGDALERCLKLAGDDWMLRGVTTRVVCTEHARDTKVSAPIVHEVLVTALLAMVDTHAGALDVELHADAADLDVTLMLRGNAASRSAGMVLPPVYVALSWGDVETLAALHGIACRLDADRFGVELRFPRRP